MDLDKVVLCVIITIHTHVIGSKMLGVKSIDYFLRTNGLYSLNTPENLLNTLGVTKTGQAENTLGVPKTGQAENT